MNIIIDLISLINYYLTHVKVNVYWGLGIGDWGLGPIPNPQSPIPKITLYIHYIVIKLN